MRKAIRRISGLLAALAVFLIPIQAFAAEEDQTMKEKMGFAVQNTVIGIVTVFLMLLLIALIIYLFRFLPKLVGRFTRKKPDEEQEKKKTVPPPVTQAAAPLADDGELVAVITAAIAALRAEEEQAPPGSFVVRTIKKRA